MLREGEETLADFARYLAAYVVEQAECLASDDLVRTLEQTWGPSEPGVRKAQETAAATKSSIVA